MSTAPEKPAQTDRTKKIASALLRYRVLAYITGIWLLVLTGEMVAKYIFRVEDVPSWIAVVHGWVYLIYLIFTVDLAIKGRWLARSEHCSRAPSRFCRSSSNTGAPRRSSATSASESTVHGGRVLAVFDLAL